MQVLSALQHEALLCGSKSQFEGCWKNKAYWQKLWRKKEFWTSNNEQYFRRNLIYFIINIKSININCPVCNFLKGFSGKISLPSCSNSSSYCSKSTNDVRNLNLLTFRSIRFPSHGRIWRRNVCPLDRDLRDGLHQVNRIMTSD